MLPSAVQQFSHQQYCELHVTGMSKEEENIDAPDSEVAFEPSVVVGEGTAPEEVPVVEESPPAPSIEHIDIGIVGGGLSGVYAAQKLRSLHPDKRIFVFEGTGVVGGKQSIPFSNSSGTGFVDNTKHNGAYFIPTEQPLTAALLSQVHVKSNKLVDTTNDSNFTEFRGASVQHNSFGDNHPSNILKAALDSFFREYPEDNVNEPYTSKRLRNTSVLNMLENYSGVNDDKVDATLTYFGEDIDALRDMSMASFLLQYPVLTAHARHTHTVDGGIQGLILNMLATSQAELQLGWRLEGIAIDVGTGTKHLRLWSDTGNSGKTVIANTVILCVSPKHAMEIGKKGSQVLAKNTSLNVKAWSPTNVISKLIPIPHFKAFLRWKVPWWTKFGLRANKSTTDRILQNIIYCDGGIMCIHATGKNALNLKDRFDGNPDQAIMTLCEELREMHSLERDDTDKLPNIPAKETNALWKFWSEGSFTWETGDYDVSMSLRDIQCGGINLPDGVFLCGSPYALSPGWMESALRSVENVLNYIELDVELWQAVEDGNVARMEEALVEGKNIFNINRINGFTLLHKAAELGDADMVDLLQGAGISPNITDLMGRTALHWGAVGGFDSIVEMLLSNGADALARDKKGSTAFELARTEGHAKVLLILSTRHLVSHWSRLQEPAPCEESPCEVPAVISTDGVSGDPRSEEDVRNDLIAVWKQFDERGLGTLPTSLLPDLVRALGESNMTREEIEELKVSLVGQRGKTFAFNDFYSYWCH